MRQLDGERRHLAVLVALVLAVAGCGSAASGHAARHRAPVQPADPGPVAPPARSADLAAARAGVARAGAWWDPHRGWYDQYLPATGHTWRATLWGIVHLFGAYNAIAIADPSRANVSAARRFGIGAERYWNPDLQPAPGYSRTPPQFDAIYLRSCSRPTGWITARAGIESPPRSAPGR